MDIKYIFIDLDGTLLNSEKKVSEYTKKILYKIISKGINIVLTSGRSLIDVKKINSDCQLSPIVISDNGAVIYDCRKNTFISSSPLKKTEIRNIWDLSIKYNIDAIFNSDGYRYRHYITLDKKYNENRDLIIDSYQEIKNDIYQVVLLAKNNDNFNLCINEILLLDIKQSNFATGANEISFADLNNKNVSKGLAITTLLKKLNVDKMNTMCFGDSKNDIEMFLACEIKVAMKNSSDEVKSIANYITEFDNNEDGVARFLEKILL